ncbi:S-adenosylhomocysteine hydrolase [Vibrio astriarenae]|nr:S-adenosylhomocysteine hydrolase [Vibrio sp. C7]
MTVNDQIHKKIKSSRRYVFERKDFDNYASYGHVGRILNKLVEKGVLMKIGYGLYTKSKINSLTSKPMPTNPGGADAIMREVLKMRDVGFELDVMSQKSLNGQSTQVPANIQLKWDPKRFNRYIKVGNKVLSNRRKA